jgi:TatD DNase family protein
MAHHVEQARTHANIQWFVVPGSTLADSAEALALTLGSEEAGLRRGSVIATAGVHPYNAAAPEHAHPQGVSLLRELISSNRTACRAVGECGLDYSEGFPASELQLPWFRSQVALALELNLPLFLHVRNAREDFTAVLREAGFPEQGPPPVPCVVHCFTGEADELRQYVEMGFHIGLTGYATNLPSVAPPAEGQSAEPAEDPFATLRHWLSIIPQDRLVIETDAPYLGFKGCRSTEKKKRGSKYPNVPAALKTICEIVATVGGREYEEVASSTAANSLRFFSVDREE